MKLKSKNSGDSPPAALHPQLPQKILCWRKMTGEAGFEGLMQHLAMVDPQRVIVSQTPANPKICIDVYPQSAAEAKKLLRNLGGRLLELRPKTWWAPQEPRAEPLRIGAKIIVVATAAQRIFWSKKFPRRTVLEIPASLAFGTGEHATTAMMLGLIARVPGWGNKRLLDVGTGTGILALAARALGCRDIEAFDTDARALAVARENDALNSAKNSHPIRWKRQSVNKLSSVEKHDVVAANLYSDLLIAHHKGLIRTLRPGGFLFLSGIFRDHLPWVARCYQRAGLALVSEHFKGKWCALHWHKK